MVISQGHNVFSLAVTDLTAEPYFALFMSGVAEFPGIACAWYTMERFGRRPTMIGNLCLTAVFSICTSFVPNGNRLPRIDLDHTGYP